jgi:hypothetical protein
VVGFDDEATARALGKAQEHALAIVTPYGVASGALGAVWRAVEDAGLRVAAARLVTRDVPPRCAAAWDVAVGGGRGGPSAAAALDIVGESATATWEAIAAHLEEGSSGGATVRSGKRRG